MAVYLQDNGAGAKILVDGVNGIAISSNCCCDNEQWKDCDTDTNQAVLSPAHTNVDFAWLCIGGSWLDCYLDTSTGSVATDPTVFKQCDNAAPTSCADLLGLPASDEFDGIGCNSGAVDDTIWTMRWNPLYTQGTTSIVANKLRLSASTPGGERAQGETNDAVIAGEFQYTIENYSFNSYLAGTGGPPQYLFMLISVDGGADLGGVSINKQLGGTNTTFEINANIFGTGLTSAGTAFGSTGSFRISRNASNIISFQYNTGGGWNTITTITNSSNIKAAIYMGNFETTNTLIIDVDNVEIVDGSDDPLYIDITGKACT